MPSRSLAERCIPKQELGNERKRKSGTSLRSVITDWKPVPLRLIANDMM
jgi:hypothetical protein